MGRPSADFLPGATLSAIFVSHSSHDDEFSARLNAWLQKKGHSSVFLDFDPEVGIPAGVNWEQELYRQLRGCKAVIVVCTEHSMASRWCFAEIPQARSLGKHLFPLKVADCATDGLFSDKQITDFVRDGEEAGFRRLERGLKKSGIDAASSFDFDPTKRPIYPGLAVFEEADAAIFFGRDKDLHKGLEALNRIRNRRHRMVLTLGASGSGKSSLVRAGILPRLKLNTDRWIVVDPIIPGNNPWIPLAQALAKAFQDGIRARRTDDSAEADPDAADEAPAAPDWREILARLEAAGETARPRRPDDAAASRQGEARPTGDERVQRLISLLEQLNTSPPTEAGLENLIRSNLEQ